jgi:hypothetical protein
MNSIINVIKTIKKNINEYLYKNLNLLLFSFQKNCSKVNITQSLIFI